MGFNSIIILTPINHNIYDMHDITKISLWMDNLNKYKFIDMKYGYINYNVKFIQSSLNIYYTN